MNEKLFTCSFFEHFENNKTPNTDFTITVTQPEYSVDIDNSPSSRFNIIKSLHKINERPRIPFKKEEVEYRVSYENISNIEPKKAHALMPSRDSLELMKFTLSNLQANSVFDHVVPVIIDDRSCNQSEMKSLADQYKALYVRVDYDSATFNFSVLNNAAAAFLDSMGVEDVILWNSDLWVPDDQVIPSLLGKHKNNKRQNVYITGTKLLYPEKGFCNLFDDNQFAKTLSEDIGISVDKIEKIAPHGKVQFGGSSITMSPFLSGQHTIIPTLLHYGRFLDREDVNFDREILFMTGAFMLCDLKKYKEVGGLNPSMRFCHQDGDLCFKMREKNYRVMYYGKDHHLYHAESMSLASKAEKSSGVNRKKTKTYNDELFSNELIFALRWNKDFAVGSFFL